MMTEKERQGAIDEFQKMQQKAFALTNEERMDICDMGFYNDVIKGYLIRAMLYADFDHEEVKRALTGLNTAFDDTTAAEAAEIYNKFSV